MNYIAVDCNEPDPSDPNGSVEFTTTTFRSEARYSCNSGFTLIGTPVAVCQANGQWSSEAPDCKREKYYLYNEIIKFYIHSC